MKGIKLFFKKYLTRDKSARQRHRNMSRIKEYMQENPVEWSPRRILVNTDGSVDYNDPGFNKDDNFKILNTDYEEIKKEIVLEGNKETRWLHSSEEEWENATLYYNNLKKRL